MAIPLSPFALTLHIIGFTFWIGGLFAIARALVERDLQTDDSSKTRFGAYARKSGMVADVGALLAIVGGLWLLSLAPGYYLHQPWLHMKLTVVVLGLLGLHGFLRVKAKRAALGQGGTFPAAMLWVVVAVTVVVIALAVIKPLAR